MTANIPHADDRVHAGDDPNEFGHNERHANLVSVGLAEVLTALNIEDDEHISIANATNGRWHTQITTAAGAADVVSDLAGNVYFGVNPINLPVGTKGRRGTEGDVTRTVALPADLDVKDVACPDLAAAHAIIDDVSMALGSRPVVVISSGRGLQPIWAIADCDATQGLTLVRRFGLLVAACARNRNAKVDTVFELVRMLRVPGTLNHKYDPPLPASAVRDSGPLLSVHEVDERLARAGIQENPYEFSASDGVVVSEPEAWAFGESLCGYAKAVVRGWKTDDPSSGRATKCCCQTRCGWRACGATAACLTRGERTSPDRRGRHPSCGVVSSVPAQPSHLLCRPSSRC